MLSYDRVEKLLTVDEWFIFEQIIDETIELTPIMSKLLDEICDNNLVMQESMRKSSAMFLIRYFNSVLNESCKPKFKIGKLLESCYIDKYYMNGSCGRRYATVNEINKGEVGLELEREYIRSEGYFKVASLLAWFETLKLTYYKQVGFEYTVSRQDKNTVVYETTSSLIAKAMNFINKTFIYFDKHEDDFNEYLKEVKNNKKSKKIQYANFAIDEVVSNLSPDALASKINNSSMSVYMAMKQCKTTNKCEECSDKVACDKVRNALTIAFKVSKNNNITPIEICEMRYGEIEINSLWYRDKFKNYTSDRKNLETKCRYILDKIQEGRAVKDTFAINIIRCLSDKGYSFCSTKQMAVIDNYIDRINKGIEKKEFKRDKTSEKYKINKEKEVNENDKKVGVLDVSNLLGGGEFE